MVKHAILILLVIFLQGTVFTSFDFNGILPEFTLLYLLYVGFFLELYTALAIAAIIGGLIDMSATFPMGTTMVIYILLIFIINYLSVFLDFRNLSSWLLGVIIGTSLICFSYFTVAEMIFEFSMPLQQVAINFFIQLFYNLFITLLFYPFVRVLEARGLNRNAPDSVLEI